MWPWGHLAVGYLSYSAWMHVRHRRAPESVPTLALVFGTQFPDIVDKPLSWSLGVLPTGRSLTHSLLVAALIVAVVKVALRRRNQAGIADAFTMGYLTHIAGDAVFPFLAGDYRSLGFLLWPVVPAVEYESEPSFIYFLRQFSLNSFTAVELLLLVGVVGLWIRDGAPGVGTLRSFPSWVARRLSTY